MSKQAEWNGEQQTRLDALRAAELAGTLDEAGRAKLETLIALDDQTLPATLRR